MKVVNSSLALLTVTIVVLFVVSSATLAKDRWDGVSVCVDHMSRNVTAATAGTCPRGSTLRTMGVEGRDGRDGTSILSGTGSPAIEVGAEGDFYLDLTRGFLHGPKSPSGWSGGILLRGANGTDGSVAIGPPGPTGPQGVPGAVGPAGTDGSISSGFGIQVGWKGVISDDEQQDLHPNAAYMGFTEMFDTLDEVSLSPGVYAVNLVGEVSRVNEPDSVGVCTLHRSSENDVGRQTFGPADSDGGFSVNGFVEIEEPNDGITLKCKSYYTYNPQTQQRDEYRFTGSIIKLDEFDSLNF